MFKSQRLHSSHDISINSKFGRSIFRFKHRQFSIMTCAGLVGLMLSIAGIRLSLISITTTRTLGGEGGSCPPLFGAYYCFPRKSSRTTLFTSEVDSSFESADCWSALSSVGEPDQFSHLPIFHIDSLYFEFRADCSAVAVDLITFSSAFKKEPLPTRFRYCYRFVFAVYPWQTSQLFLHRA